MSRNAHANYAGPWNDRVWCGPEYPKLGAAVEKFRGGDGPLSSWEPRTEPIGAARAAAQRARLLACPGQIRRAREPHEWQEMYDRAMADKRKRIADESGDVFGPKIPKPTRSKRGATV
jgi:hypothetical protein